MAEAKLKLVPFMVPNYVRIMMPVGKRQEGIKETPSLRLCDIDTATLNEMCDAFRQDIHQRAADQRNEPA